MEISRDECQASVGVSACSAAPGVVTIFSLLLPRPILNSLHGVDSQRALLWGGKCPASVYVLSGAAAEMLLDVEAPVALLPALTMVLFGSDNPQPF